MAKTFTIQDFYKRFPDDDACLEHLFKVRFGPEPYCPKCGEIGKFRKLSKHPAYTCNCGHHIHPMVGTPFHRSHVPLQKWFYAMYLFTTTRHGVPAKELQRQLGVTYKTAWRMGHEIRKYMGLVDGDSGLSGHVEVDEMYVGGKRPAKQGRGRGAAGKTVVFGMLERGGDVVTHVIQDLRRTTLERHIMRSIEPGSRISSDEFGSYKGLRKLGYRHRAVDHSAKQWVDGDTHTNAIENYWAQIKRSINGTHIHVSAKHLPKYLGEFEYRYNMRFNPEVMFARLLLSF